MKKYPIIALFLFSALSAIGQADREGFQHLLLSGSAQYSGSGQSNSGIITTSESVFLHGWMPRSVMKQEDIHFSYQTVMDEIKVYSLSSRLQLFGRAFQLGWQYMNSGDIEYREKPGPALSTFSSYWLITALGTQFSWEEADIAVTAKYSVENLYLSSTHALLADVTLAHPVFAAKGLQFISIQNLGTTTKKKNQQPALPSRLVTGWQFADWDVDTWLRLQVVSDIRYGFNTGLIETSMGIETTIHKNFRLRTGLRPTQEANPFSAGFSVFQAPFRLHYTFNYQDNGFPSTHGLSLGIQL